MYQGFVGTFEHSLDEKGRVVLPAGFRTHLASGGFLSPVDGCVALWSREEWEKVTTKMQERMNDGRLDALHYRRFFAEAAEVRPDSQGRISIPQRLRDFAGYDRDLVVNGRNDRIEIWSAERWTELYAPTDTDESYAAAMASLAL